MIKQLTSAAIAVASIGFAPLTAEAYSVGAECGNLMGYQACIDYQDQYSPDIIQWSGPHGLERIEVSCRYGGNHDWNSYGTNSQMHVEMVVNEFCRNVR